MVWEHADGDIFKLIDNSTLSTIQVCHSHINFKESATD